ncbi:hypothetical protein BDQ17DRAFT_1537998 [Cyathus striatus]|nr:hypothetical protein BDQ17DRAFT_1537998 [Cyathus striatus]
MGLFWRQTKALFIKNWIIILQRPVTSFIRCLLVPIAIGILLTFAQDFFARVNGLGLGTIAPIPRIRDVFDGSHPLVWADTTNGTGFVSTKDIMAKVTDGFSAAQLAGIKQVDSLQALVDECVANFNGVSRCFTTLTFDYIPTSIRNDFGSFNYTIRTDQSIGSINVYKHTSGLETRFHALQWAVDQSFIELSTGTQVPTPLEWPYTFNTNDEVNSSHRLNFISFINTFVALPFLLTFLGVSYHLAGAVSTDRATGLTAHLKAMGLLDSARIVSWHLSMTLAYFPSWFILAFMWQHKIFTGTNTALLLAVHVITGLGLTSWSFVIAAFFGKSPQLASVVTSGLALVLAVAPVMIPLPSMATGVVLSLFFPSMFYVFALKVICLYEVSGHATNALHTLPEFEINLTLLPMMIVAFIAVFVYPLIALWIEDLFYGVPDPAAKRFWSRRIYAQETISSSAAVLLRNMSKVFHISKWRGRTSVLAIDDLTLDIPKHGIFVLLGPNGAGKSTILSMIAGLTSITKGSVTFDGNVSRPRHGELGIVPQKNILFPELTCLQTLRLWTAIKSKDRSESRKDLEQLLVDCDLQSKMYSAAGTLSGGQKRKLQLAVGLVGGSKLVLVDECTSGVDPLSRRALWRALTSHRADRTIILTTHFLDEADFLADRVAVLTSPGKLVAAGTPVELKSQSPTGYSVTVDASRTSPEGILGKIQAVSPYATLSDSSAGAATYHLNSNDLKVVSKALDVLQTAKDRDEIASYDLHGTSMESVFLQLASDDSDGPDAAMTGQGHSKDTTITLSSGRARSPLSQAVTIFHKRALIVRRSWLVPFLALAVAISGAWWPLRFVSGGVASCTSADLDDFTFPIFPPQYFYGNEDYLASPPELVQVINATTLIPSVLPFGDGEINDPFLELPNNASFVDAVNQAWQNQTLFYRGLSMNFDTGEIMVLWPVELAPDVSFGLATNILYNRALNSSLGPQDTPRAISPHFESLPTVKVEALTTLEWVAVFGAALVAFPALFVIYVSRERYSSVHAMQLSNGLANPLGLWMGHILFDCIPTFLVATVISIVYATLREKFQGVGYLWLVLVLYGIAGTLFSYLGALLVKSPLLAFIIVTGYQFLIFLLYLTAYVVPYFTVIPQNYPSIITKIHFTMSLLAPIVSVVRAALVSVNLFSLLCGEKSFKPLGSITTYGSPILYLIVWIVVLVFALALVDSGRGSLFRTSKDRKTRVVADTESVGSDSRKGIILSPMPPQQESLRVFNVSKSYDGKKVVDDVTLTISRNSIFTLLGPNGAGKTTTLDIIRGQTRPDAGDIFIEGTSILQDPNTARLSLGVCPQFTAIDAQLTVREHLLIYGKLKGLKRDEITRDIETLLNATGLDQYADRLANKLSGGNQRKLSLAIAILGNPAVVLIDEFSTGIDAKTKRELWSMLKRVTADKAVFLTTHSMEEAETLASNVGIMSKSILAMGSVKELADKYTTYEVHFAARNQEDWQKVRVAISQIPGARMTDDVATRFEVPTKETGMSLSHLFRLLVSQHDFPPFTISKSTLETAFIRVINEKAPEEIEEPGSRWKWIC